MKYLFGLLFLTILALGFAYGFYSNLSQANSYVGKCYVAHTNNEYLNAVKVKIDKVRSDGNFNIVIYYTPEPKTPLEIALQAKVMEYNDSWGSADDIKTMTEVPCN